MPHSTKSSQDTVDLNLEDVASDIRAPSALSQKAVHADSSRLSHRQRMSASSSPTSPLESTIETTRMHTLIADPSSNIAGSIGGMESALTARRSRDQNLGQNGHSNHKYKTNYYEDKAQSESRTTQDEKERERERERVRRKSPVIGELKTNVIVKDEFTLVTDLSYNLAARYSRSESSVMIKVDHSACLALGGAFDPCYVLTVSAVASQMTPALNKRNATLIQSFMTDILNVPPERGIVKFDAIEEADLATDGHTIQGEMERRERLHTDDGGRTSAAMIRALNSASQKTTYGTKRPMSNADRRTRSRLTLNGVPESPERETESDDDDVTIGREQMTNGSMTDVRESSNPKALSSAQSGIFELAATEPLDSGSRPSTVDGPSAPRQDSVSSSAKASNADSYDDDSESFPARSSSLGANVQYYNAPTNSTTTKSTKPQSQNPSVEQKSLISNRHTESPAPARNSRPVIPPRRERSYPDPTASSTHSSTIFKHVPPAEPRPDPKLDARAAEKLHVPSDARSLNGRSSDRWGERIQRRSTITTAIPPMPPANPSQPLSPLPQKSPLSAEQKSLKAPSSILRTRKSFLAAFRRNSQYV